MISENLQQFVEVLRNEKELVIVDAPVDANLEIAEIHRRVIGAKGPAILFTNVKGKSFPVITNLFGTKKRIDLAFGSKPREFLEQLITLPEDLFPLSLKALWHKRSFIKDALKLGIKQSSAKGAVHEYKMETVDLNKIPVITSWPEDGGPFITLPLVHTKSVVTGTENLGMYRVQIHSKNTTGMHFQIGKGGGCHLFEAEERNLPLPLNLYVGGPPALILSAITPLPEDVPELIMASLLLGKKLKTTKFKDWPIPMVSESEFCITGKLKPHVRQPEGPFGDHYGYYSLKHPYPVFEVENVYHRKNAIYPATVVGKPVQEDYYLGDYLQEMLSPLFPKVMPGISDLWSYGDTGYHSLTAAVVKERYAREAFKQACRILGEGQLSFTKVLLMLDKPMDLKNFKQVLVHLLERIDWKRDFYILSELAMDTLDYTGPKVNHGSKAIFLGLGEQIRDLPRARPVFDHHWFKDYGVYCPGVLVVSGPTYEENKEFASEICKLSALNSWQLVIIVDDVKRALQSDSAFLWTTFTRFEPAADIKTKSLHVSRYHLQYEAPLIIDARMKPWYPKELFPSEEIHNLVTERWGEYFSDKNVTMGASDPF